MDRTTAILNLVAAIIILASSVLPLFQKKATMVRALLVPCPLQKKSNNVSRNIGTLPVSKNT